MEPTSDVGEDPPDRLLCRFCSNILKNAVNLPCCKALACRGCAVKNILKNKSTCVLPFCLKPSAISGLKGNQSVRQECELLTKNMEKLNNENEPTPEAEERTVTSKRTDSETKTFHHSNKEDAPILNSVKKNNKIENINSAEDGINQFKVEVQYVKEETEDKKENNAIIFRSDIHDNEYFESTNKDHKHIEVFDGILKNKESMECVNEALIKVECDIKPDEKELKYSEDSIDNNKEKSNDCMEEGEIIEVSIDEIEWTKDKHHMDIIQNTDDIEVVFEGPIEETRKVDEVKQNQDGDFEEGEIVESEVDKGSSEGTNIEIIEIIDKDEVVLLSSEDEDSIEVGSEKTKKKKVTTIDLDDDVDKEKVSVVTFRNKTKIDKLKRFIINKICIIPTPLDMYSLHMWVLHYLAITPDSLDGVAYLVWGKVYSFKGDKLSGIVRQHVAHILDQYCVYNLEQEEFSLKPGTWAHIDSNWPYYSLQDRKIVQMKKIRLFHPPQIQSTSLPQTILMNILKEVIEGHMIEVGNDQILQKLAFLCKIQDDSVVLDYMAWFFLQPKTKLSQVKTSCIENGTQNSDFRFDLITKSLKKCNLRSEVENQIAPLLGISEEEFLSWKIQHFDQLMDHSSQTQNDFKNSVDHIPLTDFGSFCNIDTKFFEYPKNIFEMFSLQTIAIQMAAAATDGMTSMNILNSLEPFLRMLESAEKKEIVRSLNDQLFKCCELTQFIRLRCRFWGSVDVNWPFYSEKQTENCLKNLSKINGLGTLYTEKRSNYMPFEIIVQILALQPCTSSHLLEEASKRNILVMPLIINQKLLHLLGMQYDGVFSLRHQFWHFVNPYSTIYSNVEKGRIQEKKKEMMNKLENQMIHQALSKLFIVTDLNSKWLNHVFKVYFYMLPMCLKDGMHIYKVIPMFGLTFSDVKGRFSFLLQKCLNLTSDKENETMSEIPQLVMANGEGLFDATSTKTDKSNIRNQSNSSKRKYETKDQSNKRQKISIISQPTQLESGNYLFFCKNLIIWAHFFSKCKH